MPRLEEVVKTEIILLHSLNYSLSNISERLNVPRPTVQSVINRYHKRGSVENLKPDGRPKKLSPTSERAICRHARNHRREPLSTITAYVNSCRTEEPVCSSTVRRALHKHHVTGRAAAKKLMLPPTVRFARQRWCRELSGRGIEYWKNIIFSDETRIGLTSDVRVWVWRRPGERFASDCTIPRDRGRRSIIYWGFMTYDGCGPLIRCSNGMNAAEYLNVMEKACIQASADFGLVYMDDNAPIHRAGAVVEWKERYNVATLHWPAYSPDLNPIENVWAYVKQILNRRPEKPTTLDELHTAVMAIWKSLPTSF